MRRRQYLDQQIQKLINKQGIYFGLVSILRWIVGLRRSNNFSVSDKTEQDIEREQSLVDQWVSLTEERNAVLVPAAGSGIPGAPADWNPPSGMEPHIPVLFLDLNGKFFLHFSLLTFTSELLSLKLSVRVYSR